MRFRPFAAAALLLASLAVPSAAQETERAWFDAGPTPLRYDLALTPNVEAGTFAGDVTITIRADEQLPAVTMNALGLAVTRATIDNQAATATLDEDGQTPTPPNPGRRAPHPHPVHRRDP
jgi:aminopeptidase N